jgi:hypothetical protein
MEHNTIDLAGQIQHGSHIEKNEVVQLICLCPNMDQPLWPLLLYPTDDIEKPPARVDTDQLLLFSWKKCNDISQFPVYLDQLVDASKNHTPHTEWNTCFEDIYTKASSLMKLTLQVIDLLKHNQNQEQVAKMNQLFKKYNEITLDNQQEISKILSCNPNPDLQDFQLFLENNIFIPYNNAIFQTAKLPNESIPDFQNRLAIFFSGPLQALVNELNATKKDLKRNIEINEFFENIKLNFQSVIRIFKKIILPLLIIVIALVVHKKRSQPVQ